MVDVAAGFSNREKTVVNLLMQGKSNNQIAHELGISVRTVEFHLGKVYTKLKVSSRTEAILKLTQSDLWESTGRRGSRLPVESPVEKDNLLANNQSKMLSTRRFSVRDLINSKWYKKPWVIVTIVLSLVVIAVGFPALLGKFGFPGAILLALLVVALVWGTYALRAYLLSSHEQKEKENHPQEPKQG